MKDAKACPSRLDVMRAAFDSAPESGFICELGVYRGRSLNDIARHSAPENIHGFDTFTGLPEFWRDGFPEGAFDAPTETLEFENNCILHKGLFDDTLPKFLTQVEAHARFIHIDCDLYSSSISALRILAPRIKNGTIIAFDEHFNCPGLQEHEHKALHELLTLSGLDCEYIAYNKVGQQVAIAIVDR